LPARHTARAPNTPIVPGRRICSERQKEKTEFHIFPTPHSISSERCEKQ